MNYKLKYFNLKKKQEEEKLKQKVIKTELLRIQVVRETTGVQCLFYDETKLKVL